MEGLERQGHHVRDRGDILAPRTGASREKLLHYEQVSEVNRRVYLSVTETLEEGRFLVERLQAGERSRNLFRALGQYGVSVYEGHFAALEQAGELEVLEDGSAILQNFALYSPETGLSLEADSGKGLFI